MKLDGYLRAHEFMQVERPPEVWQADTVEEPFIRLLGELIVLGLRGGAPLEELVLNVANVTVPADSASEMFEAGDYVAITIRGDGAWSKDVRWAPGQPAPEDPLRCLPGIIEAAGGRFAYARQIGDQGSVTVFLDRE